MRKRLLSIFMSAVMLGMTACGSAAAETKPAESTAGTEAGTEPESISGAGETVQETDPEKSAGDSAEGEKKQGGPGERNGNGGPGGRGGNGGPGGGQRAGGGRPDKSEDAELQAMIAETKPKFQLLTYEDAETGISLQYQLYVPENYDSAESYPLIQFIPDSSVVGKGADDVLTQGWGGLIFATAEEQAKHPAFVLVPVFTETVVDDDFQHSAQIDAAVRLIQSLTEQYSIDTDRLYTTGQSMGGMTSFYLNIAYPDLFAASLFVGSQWDNTLLNCLEGKNFFYIVSAGDQKASTGQTGLKEVFDRDQAPYSAAEWSAQDPAETQNKAVEALLSEGNSANFVTFTLGTTVPEGSTASGGAGEHMTSFDYAYKLSAVRDWLFRQSK